MWGRPKNRRRAPSSETRRFALPRINWRRLAVTAVSLAVVAAGVGGTVWALDQPIESLTIAGRFQRATPMEVERAVRRSVHGAGLVSVDLAQVRATVKALAWVDAVSVERSWPRGLAVTITEQVPAARWGDHGLINTRGELFEGEPRHLPSELPRLTGPEGSEPAVAGRFLAMQGRLIEAGLRLTALRLDPRGAWEFDLDDGVTVRLGRKRVEERFDTFIATASKIIAQRAADIAYVDMRYAGGFAIGWRGSVHEPTSGTGAASAGAAA